MAKHVWETRPTQEKANRMLEAYKYALGMGAGQETAMKFGGYYAESVTQSGFRKPSHFWPGKWTSNSFAYGINAKNYLTAFINHIKFFTYEQDWRPTEMTPEDLYA